MNPLLGVVVIVLVGVAIILGLGLWIGGIIIDKYGETIGILAFIILCLLGTVGIVVAVIGFIMSMMH